MLKGGLTYFKVLRQLPLMRSPDFSLFHEINAILNDQLALVCLFINFVERHLQHQHHPPPQFPARQLILDLHLCTN